MRMQSISLMPQFKTFVESCSHASFAHGGFLLGLRAVDMADAKKCVKCGRIRSIEEFNKFAKVGYHCITCRVEAEKNSRESRVFYIDKNRVKIRAQSKVVRKKKRILEPRACKECDQLIVREYDKFQRQKFCSDICMNKYNKRVGSIVRRARHLNCVRESVDPVEVFIRDKWMCQFCKIKTPKKLIGSYALNAPQLDHIIPLSKGGNHTMKNTQCLCRKCNMKKGAKERGQLRLFG